MLSSIRSSIRVSCVGPARSLQFYGATRMFNTDRTPGPPKLPKEEQEEFEELQKLANSQDAIDAYNREATGDTTKESLNHPILTKNDIGNFSPEFSKTLPEFEGNINPKTGEVNGPKQDPLRHGDYSYNGRVTDF
ncbi:FMP21 (YBR269C) [Zygosaccharomyces parabailii]|uniref:Succinate dehydrogenase assembly factor 4, mitochondrial n=1 Tax=Zygosaccharomyces bailii (strain CLIB 213 / ATCC 58445 / CBS 680 / BCRC 21525 / NBRC 1098 / NCYC 1416 / NRRL Y-2227) TaxID=1333698 RepID=A0A8J2T6I0_ZYGB2|nr:FMP21 (YBR269C) [Zygosaccharomyces parabailii]CDF88963.1 ZYBA0S03-05996g1_1 [Zygosaccharomyces bailii CLIB 213]CDH16047.1 probable protein FMP21, mitochondrial [Zygosaccharomyces bailii ISA1307]SJM83083.1 probable protein FMP21, mitochondrial [Zygosaccharomyces bailii]